MKPNTASAPQPEHTLRITLPSPVYESFLKRNDKQEVEETVRQHLVQTVNIDQSKGGLWFDGEEVKRLQALSGRGTRNTGQIVQKLEAMAKFSLEGLEVALDADVIDRASHNYRVRSGSITIKDFIAKEMINGARTSVGLFPKR